VSPRHGAGVRRGGGAGVRAGAVAGVRRLGERRACGLGATSGLVAGLVLCLAACTGAGGATRGSTDGDSMSAGIQADEAPTGIGVGAEFRIQAPPRDGGELGMVNVRVGDAICRLLTATGRICRSDADVRAAVEVIAQRQMLGACEEGDCLDPMAADYVLFAGVVEEGSGYRLAIVLVDPDADEILDERDERLEDLEDVEETAVRLARAVLGQR
jgi:hypothetical protein